MANQIINLADLRGHERNYNVHSAAQIERIAKSLSTFGQVRSIVTWHGTILAGHGVVEAARSLGWTEIRADVVDDMDELSALAYVIADNELARQSDPDQAQLAAILEDLQAREPVLVEAAGYSAQELEQLLRLVNPKPVVDSEPQVDRAEELRVKWGVNSGDLWQLGEHRLICGDCTDASVVARVMAGERADACITDPPYGIGFDTDYTRFTIQSGRNNKYDPIANDEKPFDPTPYLDYPAVVLWGANYYADKLPRGTWLVWDKRFANGEAWLSDAELAWMKSGTGVYIFSLTSQGFVRPEMVQHPTQKAVALMVWCIEKAKAGNVIYDPFAGSGTTGIACQNLGRKARMVEISPAYTAVILERFAAIGVEPALVEAAPVLEGA